MDWPFRTLVALALTALPYFSPAQLVLSGIVLIQETAQPLAYANIGIFHHNVGTLSNPDGTFQLTLPQNLQHDTLQLSALGFEKISLPLATIGDKLNIVVRLKERPVKLDAVVVNAKREKNKTFELGNDSFNGGVLETDTAYAGGSTALLIANEGPDFHDDLEFPLYVSSASLRVLKNNLPTMKFRVKLNEVDPATGTPGADILNTSVIVESDMRKGWLEFDLSSHDIVVSGPFYVTFEQILDVKDRAAIADGYREFMIRHPEKLRIDTVEFDGKKQIRKTMTGSAIDLPGTFISIRSSEKYGKGRTCYVRETSFGEWTKVSGIVTATVTLSNQRNLAKKR